jgi:hypothetical protein
MRDKAFHLTDDDHLQSVSRLAQAAPPRENRELLRQVSQKSCMT